jgi:hypothetical protein
MNFTPAVIALILAGTVAAQPQANTKTPYLLYSCFPKGPYQFNLQKCTIELMGQH